MAQYKRRQWDSSVIDLRLVKPVVNKTMLVMEELQQEIVPSYSEREAVLKRFIFRSHGCFFVYTSSVPDEVHCDEESGREDATRYTVVSSLMVFRRDGNDLVLERLRQLDFRSSHSDSLVDQFCNQLMVKALYWQQDLTEKVLKDSFAQ